MRSFERVMLSILLRQPENDMGYLEELCEKLGVLNELETVRKKINKTNEKKVENKYILLSTIYNQ